MIPRNALLFAGLLGSGAMIGCGSDACNRTKDSRPLVGNPGATTNQSAGYDASDPAHYHPQTDDTNQYRPANPAGVQPAGRQ